MSIPGNIGSRFLAELTHEAVSTRRMLERLPADKLTWKPHDKSMELGRLAGHIIEMINWVKIVAETDELDFASYPYTPKKYESADELVADFDRAMAQAGSVLESIDDAALGRNWIMRSGDKVLADLPKGVVMRSFSMNHVYHHRGQLSVYMRILDVPVPSIYGPSADESV